MLDIILILSYIPTCGYKKEKIVFHDKATPEGDKIDPYVCVFTFVFIAFF